eukprot:4457368-Pleurochrysis_carterae.AAC.1
MRLTRPCNGHWILWSAPQRDLANNWRVLVRRFFSAGGAELRQLALASTSPRSDSNGHHKCGGS